MRARNIKPGFFENEVLGQADPILSLLFAGLWCIADKAGRLEDRPVRIKAQIFPYREGLDVNRYLTDLERLGFIQRYTHGELRLIQVLQFGKHQHPHHTEKESELPEFTCSCAVTVNEPLDNGYTPSDLLIPDSLIPDSGTSSVTPPPVAEQAPLPLMGEPKRKSRQSKKGPKLTDLKPESVKAFEAAWETAPPTAMQRVQTFPGKWMDQEIPVHRGSRAQAERYFQSIVDAGHATPRELYAAFFIYTQGPRNGFYQHLSTFYGPEKATWREYLTQAREAIAEQDAEVAP